MKFITLQEASKKYSKSISTIKRIVANLKGTEEEANYLKRGALLNTGKHQILISEEYLSFLFNEPLRTTEKPINEPLNEPSNELLKTLQKELQEKQSVINKLLQNQEAFLENERNFQILLERANQRIELLEQHFNRNKKLTVSPEDKKQEEIIEETKPKEALREDLIPEDRQTFNEWLKTFSKG